MKRIECLACFLIALTVTAAHAQFSANYQTNVIDVFDVNYGTTNYAFTYSFDELEILNGRSLADAQGILGFGTTASNSLARVSGGGSLWTNTGVFTVGYSGSGNRLIVTNGGRVASAGATVGRDATALRNQAEISGSGSVLNCVGALTIGLRGSGSRLTISDGGQALNTTDSIVGDYTNANTVLINGAGSLWKSPGTLYLGKNSNNSGNQLVITNGGTAAFYGANVGYGAGSSNNSVMVSGAGSVLTNTGSITIGVNGSGNQLLVNNAGAVFASAPDKSLSVGSTPGTTGNTVVIESGGLLDANILVATNAGNSILNNGGVFQFSVSSPTLTTSNSAGSSTIELNNGIISFRGVATAPLLGGSKLTNILFKGDNGYRLNGATNNSVVSYTFNSFANTGMATNYQSLFLTGLKPCWQGTRLTIGSGGAMSVSNTQATVAGTFTNNGTLSVANATLTFSQAATLNGTVVIDLDRLATTAGVVTNTGALTLGPLSTLQFTGTYSNQDDLVLFRYAAARNGTFAMEMNRPLNYVVRYGTPTDGRVTLVHVQQGTVIYIR